MTFTLAVGQIDSRLGDVRENAERHLRSAEEAIRTGASMIAFPELSLTGYALKDLASEVALDPATAPELRALRALSRKITIIAGCVVRGRDHGIYNAGVCFEGGEVIHVHEKVYLPTYGLFEEGRHFSSGRSVRAFDTRHGRVGMLVCEDMWHMSLPYLLATDGAESIVALTASPTRIGSHPTELQNQTVNYEHQRSYARLLSVYTIFANRVGFEDGVNFWGGSAVFSPRGETVAEAPLFDEHLLIAKLESEEIQRARSVSRHVLDDRPEDVESNLRSVIEAVRGRESLRRS